MSLPKLGAGQIQYIALEGGGGAGNAFPGAIQALSDTHLNVNGSGKGILQYKDYKVSNIKGFSGASAGAITVCVLSSGYGADELAAISQMQNFNDLFDHPQAGLVFGYGGFQKEAPKSSPANVLQLMELILRFSTGTLSTVDMGRLLARPRRFNIWAAWIL
jgi:predicted acylesterase/phospholipase RssA